MNLNHMLLEDEYPDTTIIFRHVPLQNTTESKYLARISPKTNLTWETLKLITVYR